ncbi:MAG: OmpA family protein [Bacteroidales bacterium]
MKFNFTFKGALSLIVAVTPIFEANAKKNENVYLTNRFFDNWFISAGAGGQRLVETNSPGSSFTDHLTPAVSLSLGKYVAPGWAFRIKGDSWKLNTFNNGTKDPLNYFNIHAGIMPDLMSVFGTYRESRIYQLMPYVGGGIARAEGGAKSFTTNFGLINSFKVSRSVSLNLEFGIATVYDNFNRKGKNDAIFNAEIGATYYFRKRGFTKYDSQVVARAKSLNDDVNTLRSEVERKQEEIDRLSKELETRPKEEVIREVVKEVVKETQVSSFSAVLFNINSSVVGSEQMLNIANAAEIIKKNPEGKFTITGYSDKSTGTLEYNMKLSKKRAESVAKVLVSKFGVKENQLIVEGSTEQRFDNSIWNRVAVINLNID